MFTKEITILYQNTMHTHARACTHTYICTIHTRTYTYTHTHTFSYTYVCVYIHIQVLFKFFPSGEGWPLKNCYMRDCGIQGSQGRANDMRTSMMRRDARRAEIAVATLTPTPTPTPNVDYSRSLVGAPSRRYSVRCQRWSSK